MSRIQIATSALLAFLVLAACGCGSGSPTAKPSTTSGEDGVTQHKNRVAALRAKTDELAKKLDDLKARAEKATGDEKTKLQARLKEGTTALESAKKRIGEFETTGADGKLTAGYTAAQKEADAALDSLTKAVE